MNGQQQIPFDKILEKYGKLSLEREMAFDRIAALEREVELLKKRLTPIEHPKKDGVEE